MLQHIVNRPSQAIKCCLRSSVFVLPCADMLNVPKCTSAF